MTKPQGTVVRMIMPLALALFHRVGPRYFIAVGADDGPYERLIRLADHVAREEIALIFYGHPGLGFPYGETAGQGMKREA